MDALNMLTLMFSSTEVSSAQNQGQAQVTGQPAQPGIEFALLLQQQLWVNSMPVCVQGSATGESAGLFDLDLSDLTVLAGEETATDVRTVGDTLAGATGGTGAALTLSDLLAALVAELEQILGVLEETTAGGAQTADSGLAAETTESVTLTDRFSSLISTWSQLVEQLNTWLADETTGLYTLSATNLTEQPARPTATLLPWSSVVTVANTGETSTLTAGTTPVNTAQAATIAETGSETAALTLADDAGGELPQSIRWFQSVGIIGRQHGPATADVAPPQVVSTTVDLGNGETGQLTLTENPARLPGTAQAYNLQLTVPGAETSLTATLTVLRMDVLPTAETAQTVTQVMPGVEYTAPTVQARIGQVALPTDPAGNQVQLLDPMVTVLPEAEAATAVQPELVPEPTTTSATRPGSVFIAADNTAAVIADVVTGEAVPVTQTLVAGRNLAAGQTPVSGTPELALSGDTPTADARLVATDVAALTASPVQISTDVAMVNTGIPEVPVRIELKPAQTSTVPDTVKTVAVPVTDTVVDAAVADGQAVETSAWSTDYALDNLGLSTETLEALEAVMSRTTEPVALRRGEQANSLTSMTQFTDALAQPQLTVNTTDSLPLQLLQYSQASQTASTYNGLQYLEMAERIMEQVNTVRQGSGGFYQARLALNPPNLGEMFVNISVRGDAVALQLCVVSTVPKEQLKDSLESLRESLEDAGLYVTDIRVEEIQEQGSGADSDASSDSGTDGGDSGTSQARSTSPVVNEVITSTGSQRMVPAIGFN